MSWVRADNKYYISNRQQLMKSRIKKAVWGAEEDSLLRALVKKYGARKWSKMAEEIYANGGEQKKTGKQCRERWFNHLDPTILKQQWAQYQQDIMFQQQKKHGNKWTAIAEKLPGRSDNAIKNHFYSTIRKSLRRINKFLGSKDGTAKVRKIKPSTLSKIFQQISQDPSVDAIESPRWLKQREIAYHVVNFSRSKLSDSKHKLSSEEIQKLEKLLEEVEKERHKQQKVSKSQDEEYFEAAQYQHARQQWSSSHIQIDGRKQEHKIEHQPKQQHQLNWLQLNYIKKWNENGSAWAEENKNLKLAMPKQDCSSTFIRPLTPIPVHYEARSPTSRPSSSKQAQQPSSQTPYLFSFCLELQEQLEQEINPISASPWLRISPHIITPPIYKFELRRAMSYDRFGMEECDELASRIMEKIKRSDDERGIEQDQELDESVDAEGQKYRNSYKMDMEVDY